VFPTHWRLRLRTRRDQGQTAAGRARLLAALRELCRRPARRDRQTHPRGGGSDHGSIASALITGKRDAISGPVNDAMYVSSLAHVLSISGYHMAVVAGIVFFLIRAVLALIPSLASRYPIKKGAASGAICQPAS